MARKYNFIVHKKKLLMCGHRAYFATPVPQPGETVYCLTCQGPTKIPPRLNHGPQTVAEGRPRRLKENPRSNNQYTKGRRLSNGN